MTAKPENVPVTERFDEPPDEYDDDLYDDCWFCSGDGCVWGDDLSDPGWYVPDELYTCPCCNGSGNAKDCTFW